MLRELRKASDRNAEHCKKELESIKSQSKSENLLAETKVKWKIINSKLSNSEEWIHSGRQNNGNHLNRKADRKTNEKKKWKQYMRAMG